MKNSFAQSQINRFSKNFGGTLKGIADPYVSGYGFIYFDYLPPALPSGRSNGGYINGMPSASLSIPEIQNLLSAQMLGVTPPGGTLNKIEFTGLGGTKWAVPGNIDYGNTISIKFLEMDHLPITSIIHSWVKMIRDYRTGVTDDLEMYASGTGYSKKDYAAVLYYWTTAPDGKTVEYSACYDGVFPTKDPQDLFSHDVETVGRLDVEIEFSLDYIWQEDWVRQKCQGFADALMSDKDKIKQQHG